MKKIILSLICLVMLLLITGIVIVIANSGAENDCDGGLYCTGDSTKIITLTLNALPVIIGETSVADLEGFTTLQLGTGLGSYGDLTLIAAVIVGTDEPYLYTIYSGPIGNEFPIEIDFSNVYNYFINEGYPEDTTVRFVIQAWGTAGTIVLEGTNLPGQDYGRPSCTCFVGYCGAECDATHGCAATECNSLDGCYNGIYRDYDDVKNNCLGSCACESNECGVYTEEADPDGDGITEKCGDVCPGSETDNIALNPNQYAQNIDFGAFEVGPKNDQSIVYDTSITKGCTCKQIIEALGKGKGHLKKGCSPSVMEEWTGINAEPDREAAIGRQITGK